MSLLTTLLILTASSGALPAEPISAQGSFPVACTYVSTFETKTSERCARKRGDTYEIAPEILRDLTYSEGLASIAFHGHGWFYRHRNGRMMEMLTFDNGPDSFEEGFARGRVDGNMVFVDHGLNVRLELPYTFAFPFSRGRAVVCQGCVEVSKDNGEHRAMEGGKWGAIDKTGRLVVPMTANMMDVYDRVRSGGSAQ